MKSFLLVTAIIFGALLPFTTEAETHQPSSEKKESKTKEYDLLQSIQTALENNPEIQKARQRIEKQRGIIIQTRAGILPRVALNSHFEQIDRERLQTFGGGSFGTQNDWTVNIEITQSLYNGGRTAHQIKQQHLILDSSLFEFKRVVADVLLQVRERYFAVLLAREQVEVQEMHTKLLKEELETEQNRFKAGAASQFQVLRAEVELANSKTPLIRSKNNLKISTEQLRSILGLPKTAPEEPNLEVIGILQHHPEETNLETSLKNANEHRPELMQLEKISLAEKEKVEIAVSGYKPTINAVAGYGFEKSRFSSSLRDEVHGWTVGIKGTWTIFDGFETMGKAKEAVSDYKISIINLEQQRLDIDIEVRQAHSFLTEASQLVEASKQVINQAEESLRIAKSRLSVGAGTQLDVLEAQTALTQARTNEIQALHDYNVAQARLARATGQSEHFDVKEKD